MGTEGATSAAHSIPSPCIKRPAHATMLQPNVAQGVILKGCLCLFCIIS
uniref:Uncharacterized protein n=1 Tax=Arundo donax TaxID=35708 RepID=A0A0A9CTR5_ARUDO